MRRLLGVAILIGALGAGVSAGLALASLDGVSAGWAPMVSWWGEGDARRAVQHLGQLSSGFSAVLHRSEIDAPTRAFVDDALEQLSDFDLSEFYELLPETQGGYRMLRLRGELRGNRYTVRRAEPGAGYAVSVHGPRRGLLDFSQLLRAKRIAPKEGSASYLLNLRFGLGVGNLRWDHTVEAIADFGRIVANADPRVAAADDPRPSSDALSAVKRLHPKLASEDVASAALLFDAYPAVSRVFSQFGELEDMREIDSGRGYQHVTTRMRALPERLAKSHPAFATHLRKLGKVARFDLRWVDEHDHTLMRWVIDSERLSFSTECYLKEGRLLPVAGKQVLVDQGIDPMGDALGRSRLFIHSRVSMFGITVTLSNLRANIRYEPGPTHAVLTGSVQAPPKVKVEGAAAGLIDALIPGNLESLTYDFFKHAALGNDKKGALLAIAAGSESRDQGGVIEWNMELEALDSRLVKMGVGMVNERLMPSGEVMADAKRLLTDFHDAFVSDLARYKARLGG